MPNDDFSNERGETILILAPTGKDAALTAKVLREAGLSAQICGDSAELCCQAFDNAGLIFLAGEAITPQLLPELTETLAAQHPWSDIPLIVLTSGGEGNPANFHALAALSEAGNVTLIERPVRLMTLVSAIKSALRARRRQYDARDFLTAESKAKDDLTRGEERLRAALESERAARSQAETASRLKDEFLANVSHELRTPLNAMLGWTNLLRTGKLKETDGERALVTIERNARLQAQIIEDLLDVSRIITGKLQLDIKPLDPVLLVKSTIESISPAADGKDIRVSQTATGAVGTITADSSRLQQIIWNLLSNAIKFTPRGGTVEINLEREDAHLTISVRDTGNGIKADFLPFVFDRFRQADGTTTRSFGGLGLGLAIVRHLVELHGGQVFAESEGEGAGATFIVKLPLAQPAREQNQTNGASAAANKIKISVETPDDLNDLEILVVDDEADTLELIKTFLEQCGATVVAAQSVAAALEQLESKIPHVIVSDISMPEADGFQFIQAVRALTPERGGRIPAIALTAYARAEDRLRVLRSGYQMHVAKPIELNELAIIVRNVAGRTK